MRKIGQRVCVIAGMSEFVGQTGTIVDHEKSGNVTLYRVALDTPVHVPGVGDVADDLWSGPSLRNVRC